MSAELHYFSPTTPTAASFDEDLSGAIRLASITGLAAEARMGATGTGSQVFDDPTSTIGHLSDGIVGLKQCYVDETTAPAGNQRMWTGYIGPRTYRRGEDSLRLGVARKVEAVLIEADDFLNFRVFAPTADDPTSDFVRPAETDLERVQALLTTVDFISTTLFDIGYIPATGGVDMSAGDYTGRRPSDVLNDCAQVSGRNYFVLYDEATNQFVLWYDRWTTDGTATLAYDSTLRLTNVASEHDGVTTFAVQPDATETRDPSRVVSAVYLTGDGVTSYRTLASTANTFAWRDSVAPSTFVKDQAKLDALGDRYLLQNSTEDPKINCTVQIPAALVTAIHKGQRIQAHMTHLPSVASGFTWTRIMSLVIRQDKETEQFYWLDLELSPIPPRCPDFTPAGVLPPNLVDESGDGDPNTMSSNNGGNVHYIRTGIGNPEVPAPGFAGVWHFPTYNSSGVDYAGDCVGNILRIVVVGDGTLTIPTHSVGMSHCVTAEWQYRPAGAPEVVTVETQYGVPGDTFVFTIDTENQSHCTNWVDIREQTAEETAITGCTTACGSIAFGYGPTGATWTPA